MSYIFNQHYLNICLSITDSFQTGTKPKKIFKNMIFLVYIVKQCVSKFSMFLLCMYVHLVKLR